MLKITVELIPFGVGEAKEIASFFIANDGTGTLERGNYKAKFRIKDEWVEKIVENYPRKSSPVLKLVYLALKGLLKQ